MQFLLGTFIFQGFLIPSGVGGGGGSESKSLIDLRKGNTHKISLCYSSTTSSAFDVNQIQTGKMTILISQGYVF